MLARVDLILKSLALQLCVYLSMVQKLQPTLSTLHQTASDSSRQAAVAIGDSKGRHRELERRICICFALLNQTRGRSFL